MLRSIIYTSCTVLLTCCTATKLTTTVSADAIKPLVVTEKVLFDSDDPAIWVNAANPPESLVIGTDKETGGGLYAFNLQGKIVNKVQGLQRPNNVDVVYALPLKGVPTDMAVVTERETNKLRFFSLPGLLPVDGGGLQVFAGEKEQKPMGVASYTNKAGESYVIVGRKNGPSGTYLWQYKLLDDNGKVALQLVRKFGQFSGKKEIESIAVDNELGYVYYSDEQYGIRKYYAEPGKGDEELAVFGQGEFKEDNEGISIYKFTNGTGYILVSNQGANHFNIYAREGAGNQPHQHTLIASVPVCTNQSDGSEVTSVALPGFKGGLFVAMSTDRTFQYYQWADIAAKLGLQTAN